MGGSFTNSFDDCLHQVKASFPDLDLSHISIDTQGQTLTYPVDQGDTDELFMDDTTHDPQDDRETAPHEDQVESVKDETNQMVEEKDGETLTN